MNKKKTIMIISLIIGLLLLTLGVTFSIFNLSKISEKNSKLIVGDIYMHYKDTTNAINIENAMPTSGYIVNPIMKTQEYTEGGTNELSKCVDELVNINLFWEGTIDDYIFLCKGGNYVEGTLQQSYEQGYLDNVNLTNTFIKANVLTFNSNMPYFEFTIDGKNTTKDKDIWYEIILNHGSVPSGKQESNRIKDNLLKFTLTETKNGVTTTVFDAKSYSDLTNKRVWVNTIDKNTTEEIKITYRLYMWISKSTLICSGDIQDNCDYYLNGTSPSWSDVFASINVDVTGDFNKKEISNLTDESCFTTGIVNTYKLNSNMTPDELNKCITYVENSSFNEGETPEAFCRGIGTRSGGTFQERLNSGDYSKNSLTYFETNNIIFKSEEVAILDYDVLCGPDVIIPRTIQGYPVTVIGNSSISVIKQLSNKVNNYNFNDLNNYNKKYKTDLMSASITGAFEKKELTSVVIPDSVTMIYSHAFCDNQLTSVTIPDSVTTIGGNAFENNQLTSIIIPDSVTTIESSTFKNNRLTSVVIPNSVISIMNSAFNDNQLTSVTIPNDVIVIDDFTFYNNKLTNITIPDSVTNIVWHTFSNNQLTSVTIGSGIKYIGRNTFSKDSSSNPNLESITINKSCTDIKNIPAYAGSTNKYYPWLNNSSPYTASGVTIYGTDGVCDSY